MGEKIFFLKIFHKAKMNFSIIILFEVLTIFYPCLFLSLVRYYLFILYISFFLYLFLFQFVYLKISLKYLFLLRNGTVPPNQKVLR